MSISQTSIDGSPSRIHSAITRPMPAGAGEPVRAEAGGDEEAAHLALAEAELVVGRERLGAVDQPRDGDLVHRRHAPAEFSAISSKRGQSSSSRRPLKSAGIASSRCSSSAHGAECALVAAHHQARRPPRGSRSAGRGRAASAGARPARALAERLRDQVLVRERARSARARRPAGRSRPRTCRPR